MSTKFLYVKTVSDKTVRHSSA